MIRQISRHIAFFTVLYLVLFPPQAHAYLDPGTGSYILQVVAAVLFAGLFLVKAWWTQIKHIISKLFGKDKTSEKNVKDKK